MRNFTWNRCPLKNLLIDSLLIPTVEGNYLHTCAGEGVVSSVFFANAVVHPRWYVFNYIHWILLTMETVVFVTSVMVSFNSLGLPLLLRIQLRKTAKFYLSQLPHYNYQGCSVRVTRSRRFLGRVGFLRTLGVRFFYPTPVIQLNHFCRTSRSTRACWNGTISFETSIETENSCYTPRFPLVASCYKIVYRQTSFTLCSGSEILERSKSGVLPPTPQPWQLYLVISWAVFVGTRSS